MQQVKKEPGHLFYIELKLSGLCFQWAVVFLPCFAGVPALEFCISSASLKRIIMVLHKLYNYVVLGVGGIGSGSLYWLTKLARQAGSNQRK